MYSTLSGIALQFQLKRPLRTRNAVFVRCTHAALTTDYYYRINVSWAVYTSGAARETAFGIRSTVKQCGIGIVV